MRRFLTSTSVALIAMSIAGCQSSTPQASRTMDSPGRAIVVSGGNGRSTTVFLPSDVPATPVAYSAPGEAVCPECEAAAAKYFTTGVLDPTCSRTGATRTVIAGPPQHYGHN
jgi:hypothetical protein